MSKGSRKAKARAAVVARQRPSLIRQVGPGAVIIAMLGLVLTVAFWRIGTFVPTQHRIVGVDPVGYYAWVHSALFDKDLQFANEYARLNPAAIAGDSLVDPNGPKTATGYLPNAFSLGPGLLWAPFVVAVHFACCLGAGLPDGFSQAYHSAIFMANLIYGVAGAVLTYYALRTWFSEAVSTLAAVAAWACGPVLYYTYAQEAMSHTTSFFSVALLLFLWTRLRLREGYWPWLLIGAALGLATLVRWQNVTFAIIPTVDLLGRDWRRNLPRLVACGAATVLVFSPQMVAWKILFGSFITIPQGGGFMDWGHPHPIRLLFSPGYGLVTWTPLMAVGLVGLFVWPKENRLAYVALAAAFLVQLYVQAVAGNVGWAFGMRRMDNCLPLFAVGLALVMSRVPLKPRWLGILVGLFALWNVLTVLQYGGLMNNAYIVRGFEELAREHHTDPRLLMQATRLPNGEPFDLNAFAAAQVFPKGGSPTFRQMVTDKPWVLWHALGALVAGA